MSESLRETQPIDKWKLELFFWRSGVSALFAATVCTSFGADQTDKVLNANADGIVQPKQKVIDDVKSREQFDKVRTISLPAIHQSCTLH